VTAVVPGKIPTAELGYVSDVSWSWGSLLDIAEQTPELRWPQSVEVFDQMRRTDTQVASVLEAITQPVIRTPWRVHPGAARGKVVEFIADEMGLPIFGRTPQPLPRTRDRFSWSEHLRNALLMLPFGHSFMEQIYRVDPDGKTAHLRKLALRPARTIDQIKVAPDGGLEWIKQHWAPSYTAPKPIPVDRLVAYVFKREGGNWLGQSVLRPTYKVWLLKDRMLRVQAQTGERNGMGVPLYEGSENPEDPAAELTVGKGLATAWRSGEAAGTAIPHGAKLTLVGVSGTLPDLMPPIRYYDEQIARAVLAHFLNLGTETGSWALGSTFADFFTLSLQTLAMQIADTATAHVVEDLVDINFGPDEPAPWLCFDEIGSRQAATAASIQQLVASGVIHPDEPLENEMRQRYGLPMAIPGAVQESPPSGGNGYGGGGSSYASSDQYGTRSVAAAAGHHVPGEPQRYRHGWIPVAPGSSLGDPSMLHDDEATIRATFTYHDARTGLRTEVQRISSAAPHQSTYVTIALQDKNGRQVGMAERTIHPAEQRTVQHGGMVIEEPFQGQGFATRYNAHQEAAYRAHGIREITLTADIDVGGYSWARAGYDFADDVARSTVANRARETGRRKFNIDVQAEIARVADNPNSTPIEFAMIGWQPGASTWPGKQIMLGSVWDGVKVL